MFGTIRRHQKWLWMVVIGLTIPSFVLFFSSYNRVSRTSGRVGGAVCYVGGRPIQPEEFDAALREVFLEFLWRNGFLPDSATARRMGFNPEQRTYLRLGLIEKTRDLGLHCDDEAAQQMARVVLRAFRSDGITSYNDFVDRVLKRHTVGGIEGGRYELGSDDFERFAHHELAIQQLLLMQSLSGVLVTPGEAEELYRRQNAEIESEALLFHASNYLAGVKVTPAALGEFYTNKMANYRIGERAVLDYIRFPGSNYLAEADKELSKQTNLTQLINAEYLRRGTNAFPTAKNADEAKAQIKDELRNQIALVGARRAANQFLTQVYGEETNRLTRFQTFATASNLVVKTTEPFLVEDGPTEFDISGSDTNILASVTPENPVASGTIQNKDAVYAIALVRRIPSENPPFDSIREQVTKDFRQSQALQEAQMAGADAEAKLKKAMDAGKSFDEACAAAKLTPVKLPRFTLSTRSDPEIDKYINLGLLENVAFKMVDGETSGFRSMPDGGFIVHLIRRLPVDADKMKKDMPEFVAQIRRSRENDAINNWYRKLFESGYIQVPQSEEKSSSPANSSQPG